MNKKPIVKNSKKFFMFLVCFGLVLMAAGAVAGGLTDDDSLAGRLIGMGAGFGCGIIAVASVSLIRLSQKPETARQWEVNEKDERLIRIREKSAMSMWYVTLLCLIAAVFTFLVLDYFVPLAIVLALMAVHVFGYFAFLYINNNRM